MNRLLLSTLLFAVSCGAPVTRGVGSDGPSGGTGGTNGGSTGGSTGSGSTGGSTGSGSTGGTSGGSTGGTTGGSTTPDPVTRFAVIGDTGKDFDTNIPLADRWTQVPLYKTAKALAQTCTAKGGCGFALMLGDNFYKSGVSSAMDPQWKTKFEDPYAGAAFPFYAALGNHDYGQGGAGFELNLDPFGKARHQLDYAASSTKFKLPQAYYAFRQGPIDFAALDTNQIMLEPVLKARTSLAAQKTWIEQQRPSFTSPWRIAFAHHPYLSNGDHGNDGNYSGDSGLNGAALAGLALLGGTGQNLAEAFTGRTVKEFVEAHVCGKFDVYFSGHDHSLQDLGRPAGCATDFVVSGAGGSHTEVVTTRNPYQFQAAQEGFVIVEATRTKLVMTFHDDAGAVLHSRTLTK